MGSLEATKGVKMADVKKCTKCSDEFKIIDQELAFYKEKDLPLPDMCPRCRRERRVSDRHERELYGYVCDKCKKDIVVAFKPPKDFTIYCKECYQKYMGENDCILGYSDGYKKENNL
jgi:CxxC-x17-CxxC domain-containing protein